QLGGEWQLQHDAVEQVGGMALPPPYTAAIHAHADIRELYGVSRAVLLSRLMRVADRSAGLKVALINPPYLRRYSRTQRSPGVIRSGTMYYPYWLGAPGAPPPGPMYSPSWRAPAAAVLDAAGFDIFLYDCPAADIDRRELLRRL